MSKEQNQVLQLLDAIQDPMVLTEQEVRQELASEGIDPDGLVARFEARLDALFAARALHSAAGQVPPSVSLVERCLAEVRAAHLSIEELAREIALLAPHVSFQKRVASPREDLETQLAELRAIRVLTRSVESG